MLSIFLEQTMVILVMFKPDLLADGPVNDHVLTHHGSLLIDNRVDDICSTNKSEIERTFLTPERKVYDGVKGTRKQYFSFYEDTERILLA